MKVGKGVLYLLGHELKSIYEPFTREVVTGPLHSIIERLQRID